MACLGILELRRSGQRGGQADDGGQEKTGHARISETGLSRGARRESIAGCDSAVYERRRQRHSPPRASPHIGANRMRSAGQVAVWLQALRTRPRRRSPARCPTPTCHPCASGTCRPGSSIGCWRSRSSARCSAPRSAAMRWSGTSASAMSSSRLLAFRLLWGLVGGRWSRFASFVYTPGTVLALPARRDAAGRAPRRRPQPAGQLVGLRAAGRAGRAGGHRPGGRRRDRQPRAAEPLRQQRHRRWPPRAGTSSGASG